MGTAAGARRRGGRCWRARPALRRLRRSRSAVTVCRDGPGYDPIRNSFRSRPLRALGDFHTTMRIQPLLSLSAGSRRSRRRSAGLPPGTSAPPPERWPRSGCRSPAPPRRSPAASTRLLCGTYAPHPFLTPIIYGPVRMVRDIAIRIEMRNCCVPPAAECFEWVRLCRTPQFPTPNSSFLTAKSARRVCDAAGAPRTAISFSPASPEGA